MKLFRAILIVNCFSAIGLSIGCGMQHAWILCATNAVTAIISLGVSATLSRARNP